MSNYPYRECSCGRQIHVGSRYLCDTCMRKENLASQLDKELLSEAYTEFEEKIPYGTFRKIIVSYELAKRDIPPPEPAYLNIGDIGIYKLDEPGEKLGFFLAKVDGGSAKISAEALEFALKKLFDEILNTSTPSDA